MKYSEAEKKLKKAGCYLDGEVRGHPLWYSPITKQYFKMSHHGKQEISKGVLKDIQKKSGVKL